MAVRVAKACALLEKGNEDSAALRELKALVEARPVQGGTRGDGDGVDGEEVGEEGDGEVLRAERAGGGGKRKRKGKRLRSRNAFVDAYLEDEDGGDSYADLEDFIVCKKGSKY
eukprot:2051636-Rhodomonas_salina.2